MRQTVVTMALGVPEDEAWEEAHKRTAKADGEVEGEYTGLAGGEGDSHRAGPHPPALR